MKDLLRLLVATGLSGAFAAAESFQWTKPSNGNWSDANHWTPSRVPGSGDTASIPGGLTIVIDTTVSISGLSLRGGSSLSVAVGGVFNILGNLDINGLLTHAGTVIEKKLYAAMIAIAKHELDQPGLATLLRKIFP